jgi:hypothetical protein
MSLTQRFAQHLLIQDQIRRASDVVPDASKLKPLVDQAAAATNAGPPATLTPENRERCAPKRSPILAEALLQCAQSLNLHPECTAATGISPKTCLDARTQDTDATDLVDATGVVVDASADAIRLLAGDTAALGEPIIHEIVRCLQSGQGPLPASDLRAAFRAALRLYEGEERRAESAKARTRNATADARTAANKATARAAFAEAKANLKKALTP